MAKPNKTADLLKVLRQKAPAPLRPTAPPAVHRAERAPSHRAAHPRQSDPVLPPRAGPKAHPRAECLARIATEEDQRQPGHENGAPRRKNRSGTARRLRRRSFFFLAAYLPEKK